MPRLSPPAAAEYLGVPERTLRYWRTSGNGPTFIRLSLRKVVYDSEVLDAFMRSRTRQPSVQAALEERRVHLQKTA